MSKITLYEHDNYRGRSLVLTSACSDLRVHDMNDKVSSIKVEEGDWIVYEHINYDGVCHTLKPGDYPVWTQWGGANDHMSSVKPC